MNLSGRTERIQGRDSGTENQLLQLALGPPRLNDTLSAYCWLAAAAMKVNRHGTADFRFDMRFCTVRGSCRPTERDGEEWLNPGHAVPGNDNAKRTQRIEEVGDLGRVMRSYVMPRPAVRPSVRSVDI